MTKKRARIIFFILGFSLIAISCGVFNRASDGNSGTSQEINAPAENTSPTEENIEPQQEPTQEEKKPEESGSSEAEEIEEDELPIPAVEDAYDFEDFFGTYTYLTNLTVNDVYDFYITEMEGAGFEIDAEAKVGNGYVISFKKLENFVTMNILENEDGSVTVRYAGDPP